MNPGPGTRRFQRGSIQLPGAGVFGCTGRHALHAAYTTFRMDHYLFHKALLAHLLVLKLRQDKPTYIQPAEAGVNIFFAFVICHLVFNSSSLMIRIG
jgi:hypothetical protein